MIKNKPNPSEKSSSSTAVKQLLPLLLQHLQLVLDGGYNVPAGYAGRVLMGMGLGPYLGTHAKSVTREYP